MITMRQRSVNVSRIQLIEIIQKNYDDYCKQYREAIADYRVALRLKLIEALDTVSELKQSDYDVLSVKISFNPPVDHSKEYEEILEMLKMSVDDHINLDSESFRAYIKNEWNWTDSFLKSVNDTKQYIISKLQ